MTGLKIAPTLELPMEAVTETFVILAKRGSGKTYTAAVLAEEIIIAGHPCIVIDPIGVWWGLRSSSDGKTPGLPVVIFGGDHGDVPLDEKSGELIADAIVAERFSAVLDLSLLSKAKSKTFMAAFIARLYHRNRDPLHIIVDEADAFAPQRTDAGGAVLLGAMEDLVRRGRARGIGCTLITQRPAVLNKDVLTQAEVLICLRMNGVRDVQAIDEWVRLHADEDEARELKKSLPSLAVGTAWIWSPGWLGLLEQVKIRKRTTFDSSATPGVGQKRIVPKQMADIDIEALGEMIAATAEEAKASDPKVLQQRIVQLERELAKPVEAQVQRVEVPVLSEDHVRRIEAAYDKLTLAYTEWSEHLSESVELTNDVISQTNRLREVLRTAGSGADRPASPMKRSFASGGTVGPAKAGRLVNSPSVRPQVVDGSVPPARLKLLEALVSLESIGVTAAPRNQVALFAGVSPKSSGYANNLGAMNTAGLISYPARGLVQITDAGRDCVSAVPQLATTEDLHARVHDLIPTARWRIVAPLLEVWPDALSREELAERAEVSAGSSGYANNLGALRSLGLLDYPTPGMVAATDVLFIGGAS